MFAKKKPLAFVKKSPMKDVENAADAKKPGDKKEDAKEKKMAKKKGKSAKFWSNKAAGGLVGK